MAPFNLGRSVSTHSPYHGRIRQGRVGIKIEVVCKEVGSGAGCVYGLDGLDAKPVWRCSGAERRSGRSGAAGSHLRSLSQTSGGSGGSREFQY